MSSCRSPVVTYTTSSGITAKVLSDLGWIGNHETPVVLSLLVFEDLTMALYLPILTAILAGVSLVGGAVIVAIVPATVSVVLLVAFGPLAARLVQPADYGGGAGGMSPLGVVLPGGGLGCVRSGALGLGTKSAWLSF